MYSQLKNKVPLIIQKTQQGWQQIQQLCDCLQDRVELEMKYSKGMEKLAIKLATINESYSSSFGIRASMAALLSEQIKEELQTLKEQLKQQKEKPYLEYLRLWESQMESIKLDMKDAQYSLKTRKREYEIEGVLDLIYSTCFPEKADKQRLKALACKQQFELAQSHYSELNQEFDSIYEETEVSQTLDNLEQFELSRLNQQMDVLMKLFVYESSLNKNHLYDLEKMSERIQEFNFKKQIKDFVLQNYQEIQATSEYDSFITNLLSNINSKPIQPNQFQFGDDELQAEQMRKSDQLCEDFINFLGQRFKNNSSLLTLQEFISVTNLTVALLDRCQNNKNANHIHWIIKYSFGLYTKETQTRYLQDMLINHQIWQMRDLWESIIIQQITQLKNQSKEDQDTSILSILTQTSQHMILFTVQTEIVKDVVLKFCNFFKINKDISADLIIAISQN